MKPTVPLFSFGRSARAADSLFAAMRGLCTTVTQHPEVIWYQSEVQEYLHWTFPGLRSLVSSPLALRLPGALGLWVVEDNKAIHPEERAMLRLFFLLGVREVIVFVQSGDPDDEAIDLTEVALREALLDAGFPGDEASIVRGDARDATWGPSARSASLLLLDLFDTKGPPPADEGAPPLAVVSDTTPRGRSVLVIARMMRGRLGAAASLSVFDGIKLSQIKTSAWALHSARGPDVTEVTVPDEFSFYVSGESGTRMKRACVLGLPEQLGLSSRVEVDLFAFPLPKGRTPPRREINERFVMLLPYGQGKVVLDGGSMLAGGLSLLTFQAPEPFVLEAGSFFELRSKAGLLGVGVISRSLA